MVENIYVAVASIGRYVSGKKIYNYGTIIPFDIGEDNEEIVKHFGDGVAWDIKYHGHSLEDALKSIEELPNPDPLIEPLKDKQKRLKLRLKLKYEKIHEPILNFVIIR